MLYSVQTETTLRFLGGGEGVKIFTALKLASPHVSPAGGKVRKDDNRLSKILT